MQGYQDARGSRWHERGAHFSYRVKHKLEIFISLTEWLQHKLFCCTWGQAYKCHVDKILILQKRALRFMYSTKKNEHTIPLFINAKILPLNFLYYKTLSELMHDVSTASVPINICNLFTKTTSVHAYNTRSSSSKNFYIKASRLEIKKKRLFKNGC